MKYLTAFLLVTLLGLRAEAAVVFQDDFNSEDGGVPALLYDNFTNWTVTGGTVDLVGNGLYDIYPGNGLYVDLTGVTYAGQFATKAMFGPGEYWLTFDIGNNHGLPPVNINSVQVTLGDTTNTYTRSGSVPLEQITARYTVTTPSHLVFQGLPIYDTDNASIEIDNVSLNSVPEPATLGMMLVGLGAFGWRSRRRRH